MIWLHDKFVFFNIVWSVIKNGDVNELFNVALLSNIDNGVENVESKNIKATPSLDDVILEEDEEWNIVLFPAYRFKKKEIYNDIYYSIFCRL